jgi:hypothetical protein
MHNSATSPINDPTLINANLATETRRGDAFTINNIRFLLYFRFSIVRVDEYKFIFRKSGKMSKKHKKLIGPLF